MNLDRLVYEILEPELNEKGFARSTCHFSREGQDFFHFLTIDKGKRSKQGYFSITLYSHPKIYDNPGLPELPINSIDAWFRVKLCPTGEEDQWWFNDKLFESEVSEIIGLINDEMETWFSNFQSFDLFDQEWLNHHYSAGKSSNVLGIIGARLAYIHAIIAAHNGEKYNSSKKIADAAIAEAGESATILIEWINEFKRRL